jgi:leader peptidase (prepilin peptidase)/N-methyltransferase
MFNPFLPLFIFLFGLIIGSFLNCIVYRLEKEQSFLKGRSYCPSCKHKLGFWDLIPVLSFICLKGKCHYCQKKISSQYPLVELITGILFLLIFYYAKYDIFYTTYILIIATLLILIFICDLKHYIIPDEFIYPAIAITFFYQLFEIWNFGNWNLFGIWDLGFGILPAFFFLAIILFSHGQWMGLGDFKLAIFMGLFLGWPYVLIALFLAFFLGAIVGIGLIIFKKKTMKSEMPFGPFLIIGTFLVMFLREQFTTWFSSFFLLK